MRRDVFHAIADPTRRAILTLLAVQALTPNAIAGHFDTTRQAVSNHIRILAECELLKQEKQGREIIYHFNPDKMDEVNIWLEKLRELWETRFGQLDQVLKKMDSKNKS
ncbi:MAG: metalloregulator ArsR/SmtB family transcription factor [Bacteroidia bacterium]